MDSETHIDVERLEEAVSEALKPEGLSEKEWAVVRRMRAEEAAEARRAAAWRPIIAELEEVGGDIGPFGDTPDAWNRIAERFIARVTALGWQADLEVESLAWARKIVDAVLCEALDDVPAEYRPHSSVSSSNFRDHRVEKLLARLTPETAEALVRGTITLIRELAGYGPAQF
jgi:hypothetical protein